MRKITIESATAFENNENFKKSNMEVITDNHTTMLKLYGHAIAIKNIDTNAVSLSACGFKTNTTKERLNGLNGVYVMQKKGIWYLNGNEWDGKTKTI